MCRRQAWFFIFWMAVAFWASAQAVPPARLVVAPSQALPAQPDTAYSHFVGHWVGVEVYAKGKKVLRSPVVLDIKEDGKDLQFDYTFGTKGQGDYSQNRKFVALDVNRLRASIRWEHHTADDYQAPDLDLFAQSGLGRFTIVSAGINNGLAAQWRCTFEVKETTLDYRWYFSIDGQTRSA